MSLYLLAPHAFVCFTEGHAVFLDLRRNMYSALDRAEVNAVSAYVRGWPVPAESTADSAGPPSSTVIATLLNNGLLTVDEAVGRAAVPIEIQPAAAELGLFEHGVKIGLGNFVDFLEAWLYVTFMLRFWPIKRVILRARKRKLQASQSNSFNLATAHKLITIYFRLQPRFFSSIDACLRNSLTLIEFLARYGLYPQWVFGVRMEPFAAHSWVQYESTVLNDSVRHTETYTPIMAI